MKSEFWYYAIVILLSAMNVAGALVAYFQRKRQINSGQVHQEQLSLSEQRTELAERRALQSDVMITLLEEILDQLKENHHD